MITIKTRLTEERYKRFFWFHMFLGYVIILGITLAWVLIIDRRDVFPGLILLGLFCLYSAYSWLSLFISSAQHEKDLLDSEDGFTFDGDGFSIKNADENINEFIKMKYEHLYRVYETKDTIYVYPERNKVYILPKWHIVAGSEEGLQQLLQSKLPRKRYKIVNNRKNKA